MHLLPREIDKLVLFQVASLAQRRLARGCRLNLPETTALISFQLLELIRDGTHSVSELMDLGKRILGLEQVMDGVSEVLRDVQVEGTFGDGTKLVTVHSPVVLESVDCELALYGSFLPVPKKWKNVNQNAALTSSNASIKLNETDTLGDEILPFQTVSTQGSSGLSIQDGVSSLHDASINSSLKPLEIIPGEVRIKPGTIHLNRNRAQTLLKVSNMGDRPIQVGSHYSFIETNAKLQFDRLQSIGKRLDIPAGTAVRFEPGETKTVTLVDFGGHRVTKTGNRLVFGPVDQCNIENIQQALQSQGFLHLPSPEISVESMSCGPKLGNPAMAKPYFMDRHCYADAYGPTTGDRIRLADSSLVVEIEHDCTEYGDEIVFGGGKVIREGMGQCTGISDSEALDLVITNSVIIDYSGIYKADIGIKNGRIVGIGKAGNPDVMAAVTNELRVGVTTEVLAGEGKIVTAGAVDTHVHFICPQLCTEVLKNSFL